MTGAEWTLRFLKAIVVCPAAGLEPGTLAMDPKRYPHTISYNTGRYNRLQ
jgi:hypothetical protein